MLQEYQGKVVVVTGGNRGIGKEIATGFARAGALVMICGTAEAALKKASAELASYGESCEYIVADLTKAECCEQIVRATLEKFKRIDILINNAGVIDRNNTMNTTREDWQRVMNVNLNGSFFLSQLVLAEMQRIGGGNVINITSTASTAPHPNASPSYGASKAAMTYLTKHFAMEFAADNIRVNAIQCGPIESEMTEQWSPEYRQRVLGRIPLGRLGKPLDVAEAAMYLCSERAGFITGTSLNLSGGKLI